MAGNGFMFAATTSIRSRSSHDPKRNSCRNRRRGNQRKLGEGVARFSLEIRGSKGSLSLTGGHPYCFQAGDLKLTSSAAFASPEEAAVSGGLIGAAINVGEIYAHLARDVRASTPALHNARLIEAVRRAAERETAR
jgi:predicted dehydrogenase